MSKLRAQGNASGTGVFTLETPATNTDRTITLPDSTGTLATTAELPSSIVDNGDATAITIDSSENVGIGTTSPAKPLHVYDVTANSMARFESGDSESGIILTDTTGSVLLSTVNKELRFYTNGNASSNAVNVVERMRIDSSGNTFWGTATLHETNNQGGISLWNIGNYNRQILQIGHTDSGNRTVQQFFGNSSETPAGVISCTGVATTYATSSDYRLKENIVPMSASIDRLKQLNPVNFNFIADATTTVDGFLAHEAQAVVPEAVTGTKDAMQTKDIVDEDGNVTGTKEIIKAQAIDQSKLVPLLTSALQEAVAKIEALEQRVTTLEGGTV